LQMWRVKEATKCPKRTIWRILEHLIKHEAKGTYSNTPGKIQNCWNVWQWWRVIRYIVHKFCVQEIMQQTVTKLLLQLRYQLHFTGSIAAYKTVNGLGFL
jgi:hypothetical protein